MQALRSPNVRGDWGQMQLRRTVEMAGMLGHCDFFEQISEATENGRLTPDMIVRLPGDRRVVVDAKAPRMYLEGLADRTEAERSQYLRDHAAKVRAHMTLLSGKRYWEQFAPTPEFVVMFLPVEALFAAALQEDPGLLEFGVDKKVIPASPLTLIALLRAVNYGWKQESLAHDASRIRELGKDLYNSVRVLAGHLVKMRNNLEDTVQAFNASVGSVERSFLSKARKLVGAERRRRRHDSAGRSDRRAASRPRSGRTAGGPRRYTDARRADSRAERSASRKYASTRESCCSLFITAMRSGPM